MRDLGQKARRDAVFGHIDRLVERGAPARNVRVNRINVQVEGIVDMNSGGIISTVDDAQPFGQPFVHYCLGGCGAGTRQPRSSGGRRDLGPPARCTQ